MVIKKQKCNTITTITITALQPIIECTMYNNVLDVWTRKVFKQKFLNNTNTNTDIIHYTIFNKLKIVLMNPVVFFQNPL